MKLYLEKDEDELREKFFNLKSNSDIADLFEIDLSTLIYYTYRIPKEKQYKEYTIPKRDGKQRIILAPVTNLKIIQRKFNSILQTVYTPRNCAYGFVKNKNVILNAKEHKSSRVILKIDLKDFFGQIHFGRVRGIMMSKYPFGFNSSVATTLANICTFNSKLPQGAPTSPVISNIICWGLDKDLQDLIRNLRCKYTRYADDIIISTKAAELPKEIISQKGSQIILGNALHSIFEKHRLEINYEKITLYKNNKRQLVTGLVVNEFVNVKREYVRQLRKELFIWEKYGIQKLLDTQFRPTYRNPYKKPSKIISSIQGKIDFLKQVRTENNDIYQKLQRWFNYLRIRDGFNSLKPDINYQARGYALEDIFNKLFKINKIDVKESFRRNEGIDQIDGAFLLSSGTYFIVECKWSSPKTINKSIKSFLTDVRNSGEGTKGLFISVKGWNKNAIKVLKLDKSKNTILMNGKDFNLILNNRKIDLEKLVEWKLKALMFENKPFVRVKNYKDYISSVF